MPLATGVLRKGLRFRYPDGGARRIGAVVQTSRRSIVQTKIRVWPVFSAIERGAGREENQRTPFTIKLRPRRTLELPAFAMAGFAFGGFARISHDRAKSPVILAQGRHQ